MEQNRTVASSGFIYFLTSKEYFFAEQNASGNTK